MKVLADFLPIIVFFIVFKFCGIYPATASAIIVSLVQTGYQWIKYRELSLTQLISLVVILIFGGSTLIVHDDIFIKWKPTALNWILAITFLASQLFTSKPFIQRLMEDNIALPINAWRQLNLAWVVFFSIMGFINLFVAYHFDTNTWVNFKLFGLLGFTVLFAIAQAFYLSKYLKDKT